MTYAPAIALALKKRLEAPPAPKDEKVEKLIKAAEDALHTLENTKSCEPGWQKGSVELLRCALRAFGDGKAEGGRGEEVI